MGKDEKALLRLWREKRGAASPLDLAGVLVVQLGLATEDLNCRWYEFNAGHRASDVQRHAVHRSRPWMAATLDGLIKETGAVFEAKFMLPWSFSEEAAAERGHGIRAKRSKSVRSASISLRWRRLQCCFSICPSSYSRLGCSAHVSSIGVS
jgi:hypothetical protein